jgi:hypothetical protein
MRYKGGSVVGSKKLHPEGSTGRLTYLSSPGVTTAFPDAVMTKVSLDCGFTVSNGLGTPVSKMRGDKTRKVIVVVTTFPAALVPII